jgi:hypothetical protein
MRIIFPGIKDGTLLPGTDGLLTKGAHKDKSFGTHFPNPVS